MLHGLPPAPLPCFCPQGSPAYWNVIRSALCLPVTILPLCDQIHKARGQANVHAVQPPASNQNSMAICATYPSLDSCGMFHL